MITFQTLENTSIEEILNVFNESFSDYIVPLRLTAANLEEKIQNDRIQLELSVGAFEKEKLIGFILHGFDIIDNLKVVYNAGTGVIPSKRGNKITAKLYEFILPILHENDIDKVILEVITTNEAAIKTYKNIGFTIIKEYNCVKGSLEVSNPPFNYEIGELKEYNWQQLQSFWDIKPSWQNSITAAEKLKDSNISIGVFDTNKVVGYAIFNPKTKRLHQLSVDKNYRKKGIATQLLNSLSSNFGKEISITNIDNVATDTLNFLEKSGLKTFVMQYEMELILK